jgi:hypothetical protein
VSLVVITIQDDEEGEIDVKAMFEPAFPSLDHIEDATPSQNLGMCMMKVAMDAGGE